MDCLFRLQNLDKSFGENRIVKNVNIEVKAGEVFSLLGPSGCGKTTLLKIAGGFEEPDAGSVFFEGKDITKLPPNKRNLNTVFQNYALFPNMTVFDNIAFGPRMKGFAEPQVKKMVQDMLALIRLEDLAWRMPGLISGGQKQRVAIGRALINNPKLLLLDEPLAALDLKLRQHMLLELSRIHEEVGISFIYVTHDQNEAMSLSNTIAVMNQGEVEQVGTPQEIYENPQTKFVASFIGDTNFFNGTVTERIDARYCKIGIENLGEFVVQNEKSIPQGTRVSLSIRPEKLIVSLEPPTVEDNLNAFPAQLTQVIYNGASTRYLANARGFPLMAVKQHSRSFTGGILPAGSEVWIAYHMDDVVVFPET